MLWFPFGTSCMMLEHTAKLTAAILVNQIRHFLGFNSFFQASTPIDLENAWEKARKAGLAVKSSISNLDNLLRE